MKGQERERSHGQPDRNERVPAKRVMPLWERPSVEVVGPISKIVRLSRSRRGGGGED